MTIETISEKVGALKRRYGEREPERLCQCLGVRVLYLPMGEEERACKGFFIKKSRIPLVVVNWDLPPEVRRIILAHELGHAALHSKLTDMRAFHDFAPFDQTSVYEYEANLFAAEFLMDDEDVLSLLNEDCSFFDAARMLRMPPELLDFKFRVLKRKGYALNPPLYARSDFLKEMPASAGRPGESAISR